MSITWCLPETILSEVKKTLVQTAVVLDIGCGIRPQTLITPKIHLCCEPFDEYLNHLHVTYGQNPTYILLKGTWKEVLPKFYDKTVDTVFLLDVIEHLEKEEGFQLLKEMERVARKQVIVFTPLGFLPQSHTNGKDAWGYHGTYWQEHRSGWQLDDFGNDWDLYAAKDAITTDNNGKPLPSSFGVMWAVKTLRRDTSLRRLKLIASIKKNNYRRILESYMDRVSRLFHIKI